MKIRVPRAHWPQQEEDKYANETMKRLEILHRFVMNYLMNLDVTPPDRQDSYMLEKIKEAVEYLKTSTVALWMVSTTEELAYGVWNAVNSHNRRQLKKQNKVVMKKRLSLPDTWAPDFRRVFVMQNARLINTIPLKYFTEIETLVEKAWGTEITMTQFADDVEQRYGVTRSRAELISRDQVGKLNGQLTMLHQMDAGINSYVWRTQLDGRVRPTHKTKEGLTFSWIRPPLDTGHPGQDINCRCTAEPVFKPLLRAQARVTA